MRISIYLILDVTNLKTDLILSICASLYTIYTEQQIFYTSQQISHLNIRANKRNFKTNNIKRAVII